MDMARVRQRESERSLVLRGAASIFVVSAAVIGLELALMRCLSLASWHHFAYLVISTALLGFGASGTLLSLVGHRLERHFRSWNFGLILLLALSAPLCFRLAQTLPLDVRYVIYSRTHAAWMVLYHLLIFVPFLVGGTIIGLSLMHFGDRVHAIYGANLAGSGAGGALLTGCMFLLAPGQLLYVVSGMALVAAVLWVRPSAQRGRLRGAAWAILAILLLTEAFLAPVSTRVDSYKMLATLQRWEGQSSATRLLTRTGPRAHLTVYDSPRLHQTLFAGLTAAQAPPEQLMILADGSPAATVFKADSSDRAEILDHTPMSVPYRLVDRPNVLLLGEAGGVNVWLALRQGARHVTVVQSNPQILELMRGPLADESGGVFLRPDVTVVESDPRLFLERREKQYDVIQLVTTEEMTAGSSGLHSLREDFLLTTQGLSLCMDHLTDRGLLSATRGVQMPPRDNIKLFASMAETLEGRDVRQPGRHLIQYRNYLAATTLAARSPVSDSTLGEFRKIAGDLGLEATWLPGGEAVNGGAQAKTEQGARQMSLSRAAQQILSPRREQFYGSWVYNVRPAGDDAPYFHNFFRWESLWWFVETYGSQWLQRLELGYVVLAFSLAEVAVVGATLILLPLLWLRRRASAQRGRLATAAYFLSLGLAFMMVEMTFIMEFTRFLGDPIYAAAGMVSTFLVFSGVGSATVRRIAPAPERAIPIAAGLICGCLALYLGLIRDLLPQFASWPTAGRVMLAIAVVAPIAFLMGWMFPGGLSMVREGARPLVPWAWGVNGFASVAASPAAVLLAISWGYSKVLVTAGVLYLLAAAVSLKLPGREDEVMR